ncbi:hypothetical protein LDENG_00093840, partial [Lucifuga dentata]
LKSGANLDSFSPVSLDDVTDLLRKKKPSSGPLDILPTSLFLKCFNSVGSSVLSLINLSLSTKCVLSYFKHAIVEPLLKKPNLDPSLPENYRPISKLPFLSKILGSVLGPILFMLYMLPLGQLIANFNISYHFYADDIQLCCSFKHHELHKLAVLNDCQSSRTGWLQTFCSSV